MNAENIIRIFKGKNITDTQVLKGLKEVKKFEFEKNLEIDNYNCEEEKE